MAHKVNLSTVRTELHRWFWQCSVFHGAAGIIMRVMLLFLSLTNFISTIAKWFPKAVIRGIQLSIGLTLLRRGIESILSGQFPISGTPRSFELGPIPLGLVLSVSTLFVFVLFRFVLFKGSERFPASLALFIFGLEATLSLGYMPAIVKPLPAIPAIALSSSSDLWIALVVLVITQLPLTLGNAVVSTADTAKSYFGDRAVRVKPRALATSMGLANIAAGLIGAMPVGHGSGGLTAHYKLGARTGGANLMIGGLLVILGILFGATALSFLLLIPLSVLGVLLAKEEIRM